MYRTKLVCDDPVVPVVTKVDPQGNRPILCSDSALFRNDSIFELGLKGCLLQNPEVGRLRLKGEDLAIGIDSSCQNGGRVTDVRADIKDISIADEIGIRLQQVLQIVFDVAFVLEVSKLE
jgi:hypothetical protein